MKIAQQFDGKNIMIWGYGREGKSTEEFLKRYANLASVTIFEGKPEELDPAGYDYVIKSPGIVFPQELDCLTSATDIFLAEYRNQVIGVTGTKGKSTTCALLAHVLSETTGRPVLLMGNIGKPCLDYYGEITPDTIVVFEMSCHQLAHLKMAPRISVFLNLFEEHLDYYGSMEAYFTAKSHIATKQQIGDLFLCGENVPEFEIPSAKWVITKADAEQLELKIPGAHNLLNAAFVRRIAESVYGCNPREVTKALQTFVGLPHRLMEIGTYAGITWYDDSISTIPEAAISAIACIETAQTLLIGGMDRGIGYLPLEQYILAHPEYHYICMYASGKRVYEETLALAKKDCLPQLSCVSDLEEAVRKATEMTEQGKACILSPAAASYGYFKNFEERGDVFAQMVKNL